MQRSAPFAMQNMRLPVEQEARSSLRYQQKMCEMLQPSSHQQEVSSCQHQRQQKKKQSHPKKKAQPTKIHKKKKQQVSAPPRARTARSGCRPRPHDVLMGRGQGPANHPGNIRYRQIVLANLTAYQRATQRRHKTEIMTRIRHQVEETGGNFVCQHSTTKKWKKASDDAIQRKIGQTVRYMGKLESTAADEEEAEDGSVKSGMSSSSSSSSSMKSTTTGSSKQQGSSPAAATKPRPRDVSSSSLPTPPGCISSSLSRSSSVMENDNTMPNHIKSHKTAATTLLVVSNHDDDAPPPPRPEPLGGNADQDYNDDDDDSSFSSLVSFLWDEREEEEEQQYYHRYHIGTTFQKGLLPTTCYPDQEHSCEGQPQHRRPLQPSQPSQPHDNDDNDDSWSQLTALEAKQGAEPMSLAALDPAATASGACCVWNQQPRCFVSKQVSSIRLMQRRQEPRSSSVVVPLPAPSSCARRTTSTTGAPNNKEGEEDPFIGLSLHLFPAEAASRVEDDDHWMAVF